MNKPLDPIAQAAQRLAGVSKAAPKLGNANNKINGNTEKNDTPLLKKAELLKRRCARKALLGAGSSLLPIPLIDLAVDAVLLANLFNEVQRELGLSPAQINALDASKKHRTYAAIQFVGNRLIGTLVTRAVIASLVKGIGVKLTAQQLTKAVPVAGQIASAGLNYATLRYLINRHIDDCVKVLERAGNGSGNWEVVA